MYYDLNSILIRMSFGIIFFYFVALITLQDNTSFSFLFEESLFPKLTTILLPIEADAYTCKDEFFNKNLSYSSEFYFSLHS